MPRLSFAQMETLYGELIASLTVRGLFLHRLSDNLQFEVVSLDQTQHEVHVYCDPEVSADTLADLIQGAIYRSRRSPGLIYLRGTDYAVLASSRPSTIVGIEDALESLRRQLNVDVDGTTGQYFVGGLLAGNDIRDFTARPKKRSKKPKLVTRCTKPVPLSAIDRLLSDEELFT